MKHTFAILIALLLGALPLSAQQPLLIERQGHFSVGGTTLQRPGQYDNSKFVGWAEQVETGQSARVDHAFVDYQVPVGAKGLPLVFVHGYGGSGVCWEMTPDGRDGFATLMLRRGFAAYVMDLPGRGRAGRTSATTEVKPLADEMFWFDIWRIGIWPHYNKGVQFPTDSAYLSQFFREMTPDLSDHLQDVPAINALADRLEGGVVLVTHSAGGIPGWIVASQNKRVRGVVAYEPGAFVFPEGEVPEKIDGLTGGSAGIPIPREQFRQLCSIPIVIYFGDYIPEKPSRNLGDENWRVRLQMARKFVAAVNRHGGHATLVELPKIGIHGNTHFLMQDLNNARLADLLSQWLADNGLAKAAAPSDTSVAAAQRPDMPFAPGRQLDPKAFHGEAYIHPLTAPDSVYRYSAANVITFAPGAHSDYHRHGAMDVYALSGEGIYQQEGRPEQVLHAGDVVHIPAGVSHRHGATPSHWFQQIVVYDKQ